MIKNIVRRELSSSCTLRVLKVITIGIRWAVMRRWVQVSVNINELILIKIYRLQLPSVAWCRNIITRLFYTCCLGVPGDSNRFRPVHCCEYPDCSRSSRCSWQIRFLQLRSSELWAQPGVPNFDMSYSW